MPSTITQIEEAALLLRLLATDLHRVAWGEIRGERTELGECGVQHVRRQRAWNREARDGDRAKVLQTADPLSLDRVANPRDLAERDLLWPRG